jgi:hypothetical protein
MFKIYPTETLARRLADIFPEALNESTLNLEADFKSRIL